MNNDRREFLAATGLGLLGLSVHGVNADALAAADPIVDIHQHLGYSGRPDDVFVAHQLAMGATTTILLPAGRPVNSPSTHDGVSNGLQAQCLGNEACRQFARAHKRGYLFGANEVPDIDLARRAVDVGHLVGAEQIPALMCASELPAGLVAETLRLQAVRDAVVG